MNGSESTPSFWERLVQRRHFLVHPQLQYELVGASLRHVLLVAGAGLGVLFVPLAIQLFTNEARSVVATRAADHLLFLHDHYWPSLALILLFVGLDAFRTSHRIAGPIYRFRLVLEEIRSGRTPRTFALRRGDLLADEARAINAAIRELTVRRAEDAAVRGELVALVREARDLRVDEDLLPAGRDVLRTLFARVEAVGAAFPDAAAVADSTSRPGLVQGGGTGTDGSPGGAVARSAPGTEEPDRRAA